MNIFILLQTTWDNWVRVIILEIKTEETEESRKEEDSVESKEL